MTSSTKTSPSPFLPFSMFKKMYPAGLNHLRPVNKEKGRRGDYAELF